SIFPAAAAVGLAFMSAPSLPSPRSSTGRPDHILNAVSPGECEICGAPSSATERSCPPAAPQRPAFLGDQAAPHSVRADAARVAERKLQAVRPHRAPGADRDGPGGPFPRPPYIRGEREPLVRIQA